MYKRQGQVGPGVAYVSQRRPVRALRDDLPDVAGQTQRDGLALPLAQLTHRHAAQQHEPAAVHEPLTYLPQDGSKRRQPESPGTRPSPCGVEDLPLGSLVEVDLPVAAVTDLRRHPSGRS